MPLQTYANTFGPPQQIDYNNLLVGPKIKRAREQSAFNQQKIGIAQQASVRADEAATRSQTQLDLNEDANTRAQGKYDSDMEESVRKEFMQKNANEVQSWNFDDPNAISNFIKRGTQYLGEIDKEKYNDIGVNMSTKYMLSAAIASATEAKQKGTEKAFRQSMKSLQAQFGVKHEENLKTWKEKETFKAGLKKEGEDKGTPEDKDKIMKRRSDVRKQMSAVKKAKATIDKVDTMTAMLQGILASSSSDSAPEELLSLPIGAKIPEELKNEAFTAWDNETDMLQEELDYLDERIGGKKKAEKEEAPPKANFTFIPGQGFVAQ